LYWETETSSPDLYSNIIVMYNKKKPSRIHQKNLQKEEKKG